ncbi:hypothetical protein [Curtobacterium sp. L1-20]|uniref:hypothetical protein n=1 Tax=Curtobacterium sp. L1-20 TaxID=3138181 RepID=UPI003B52B9F3
MDQRNMLRGIGIALVLSITLGVSACSASSDEKNWRVPSSSSTAKQSTPADASHPTDAASPSDADSSGQAAAVTTPLGDATQDWPATDLGQRQGAMGQATEETPGVYRYVAAANDTTSGLLERFDLCQIDIALSYEADGGQLTAGHAITVQRHLTDGQGSDTTDDHRGWKCTYPEQPRTSRTG